MTFRWDLPSTSLPPPAATSAQIHQKLQVEVQVQNVMRDQGWKENQNGWSRSCVANLNLCLRLKRSLSTLWRLPSLRPRLITYVFHRAWFAACILLFANQLSSKHKASALPNDVAVLHRYLEERRRRLTLRGKLSFARRRTPCMPPFICFVLNWDNSTASRDWRYVVSRWCCTESKHVTRETLASIGFGLTTKSPLLLMRTLCPPRL